MGGPPPATIELSTRQRTLLEQLRQRQTAPQRLVRRVRILLALAANPCLQTAAGDLGLNRISVRLWRDRWRCERRRESAARGAGRRSAEMGDTLGLTHCYLPTMEAD